MGEIDHKLAAVTDRKPKNLEPFLMEGSSEAEAFYASASSSLSLSFELDANEVNLCLDCINRERLDFSGFVCPYIELFHASFDGNYFAQMQLSGL